MQDAGNGQVLANLQPVTQAQEYQGPQGFGGEQDGIQFHFWMELKSANSYCLMFFFP